MSLEAGEPLAGTGALQSRYLFLRWPRGDWRRPRYESAGMSAALQGAIRNAMGNGRHVGLVDGDPGPPLQLWSYPGASTFIPASETGLVAAITIWGESGQLPGLPEDRLMVVCCTDAKTDACCARFGYPLFKALAEAADQNRFLVLQATHIGGCHLAPSLAVFPLRARYGRLRVEDASEFLHHLDKGEHYLPAFKGSAHLGEMEQVAEIAALQWAEAHGRRQSEIQLFRAEQTTDSLVVEAAVGPSRLRIALEPMRFEIFTHCRQMEQGDPQPTRRWIVREILEVS